MWYFRGKVGGAFLLIGLMAIFGGSSLADVLLGLFFLGIGGFIAFAPKLR